MSEISTLLTLRDLDVELTRAREDAESVPRAIARVEARIRETVNRRDAVREANERSVRDRRDKERRVEDIEAERRRFERQLLEVKKNDEYTALLHEIDQRRKNK